MTDVTSRRNLILTPRVVGVVTGLLLLIALGSYLTGDVSLTFADLGVSAAALLAAVNCALAARSASGRLRVAWAGLAGATLSWAVGEAIWSWYELILHQPGPFPGLADLGYLGFPLGAVIAVAVFPSNVSHADRRRMTLDGLITAGAIGLISWATTLGAVVHAGADSLLGLSVSVAYPASDIALLVVCVLALSRSRAHRVPLGFIATGLVLMALADSGYTYLVATNSYASGNPIDLGWFFAFGMLAFASLTPGATADSAQAMTPTVAGTFLPYVPLGGAIAILGWQTATRHAISAVETVLAVVIVLLVLLRQFLTVRDNQLLARTVAEREAQLRHQAFHDQLTGLANRALFIDRAAHALELHRRDRRPVSICFIDLDGFKAVNDHLGHKAGDDVLKEASTRFREVLSDADTLARFGGDEYAVLLEDQPDPLEVARALFGSLNAPFNLGGREVSVQASIGVAQVDLLDPTPTVDELLVRADLAMYVVKRRGKADVLLHTAGLQLDEVDDVTLGRALAQALADNELTVSYQPIINLSTGRLDKLEALARWAPGGRPVSPEVFVRVADSSHLIDSLFRFVLGEACAQLARWTALPGGSDVSVAVNISPSQLSSPALPQYIAAELARHGLAGDRLVLEITETGGLVDTATSQAVCHELRRLGVGLSMDDLGTGLSSLARLRDLPINEVKIDRSFVSNLDQDDARRRFVWGVVAFAERVGLTVVAEGVEREAERDALTRLGCHRAQGFLFSRPVPARTVDTLLRSPGSWLLGIPASPPEPPQGKVRQRARDYQAQLLDEDAARVAEPLD
ncbi:MAG TPA: GGDEF and EAL domain-containing protein [Dermatophilaceae bacterium]